MPQSTISFNSFSTATETVIVNHLWRSGEHWAYCFPRVWSPTPWLDEKKQKSKKKNCHASTPLRSLYVWLACWCRKASYLMNNVRVRLNYQCRCRESFPRACNLLLAVVLNFCSALCFSLLTVLVKFHFCLCNYLCINCAVLKLFVSCEVD